MTYRRRWSWSAFAVVGLILSTGCSSTKIKNAPVTLDPVQIDDEGTLPIAFKRVIIRIEPGTQLGASHSGIAQIPYSKYYWQSQVSVGSDEFNLSATEELRNLGYTVYGYENLLFGEDQSAKARYQLGGEINEIRYNTFGPLAGNYSEAAIAVKWQLYDTLRKVVIFTETAEGYAKIKGRKGKAITTAFTNALRNPAADQEFVALISKSEGLASATPTSSPRLVVEVTTSPQATLPDDFDSVLESVVVLKVGSLTGSGAVISTDGYILTAAHVVSGVDEVTVSFRSGMSLPCNVVRVDEFQDVALLKAMGSGFKTLSIRLDDQPGIGADLYAVGSPLGEELAFSTSKGVLSGYRNKDGVLYIQTDASLNPGNSGGPLLDDGGQLIGIVSRKLTGVGVEGLAFGVPVTVVGERLRLTFVSEEP